MVEDEVPDKVRSKRNVGMILAINMSNFELPQSSAAGKVFV